MAGPRPGRKDGASQSKTSLGDHYRAWLRHHQLSATDSLYRVVDGLTSSLLTWLVIGIALAMPVGLNVALDNSEQLSDNWDSPAQLSVFLKAGGRSDRAAKLQAQLQGWDSVDGVSYISREAALAEFSLLSGFADVLADLDDNPLPDLLLVSPARGDGESVDALTEELAALPGVAQVVVDMAWLQRLNSLLDLSRRAVLALGALLVFGVILILGNTIRLTIESRRDEIVIVKLVGGSNAFVRRPLLYTGLWYGLGGGLFAAILVALALLYLQAPVGRLAALYGTSFELSGLGLMGSLNLVMVGGLLGLAGAWLAVSRHLAAIEPR
ncbi:MAG: permease-like cell division protein FtsX [Pseudomonadota bacterium]